MIYVHRWLYEHFEEGIPDGWHVHHECGRSDCVRPDHMLLLEPEMHRVLHRRNAKKLRNHRESYPHTST